MASLVVCMISFFPTDFQHFWIKLTFCDGWKRLSQPHFRRCQRSPRLASAPLLWQIANAGRGRISPFWSIESFFSTDETFYFLKSKFTTSLVYRDTSWTDVFWTFFLCALPLGQRGTRKRASCSGIQIEHLLPRLSFKKVASSLHFGWLPRKTLNSSFAPNIFRFFCVHLNGSSF